MSSPFMVQDGKEELPRRLQDADDTYSLDFYSAGCREFSFGAQDWNEAFQCALEMPRDTEKDAERRQRTTQKVYLAFEQEVLLSVKKIVDSQFRVSTGDTFTKLPEDKHSLKFRDGNIFFRVLNDVMAGRKYLQSLNGVIISGTDMLSIPLSVLIVYRGVPFLAQALTALSPTPIHNGTTVILPEVQEELRYISTVINVPFSSSSLCHVFDGIDGRRYVTQIASTTIPLSLNDLGGQLQRSELLLSPFLTPLAEVKPNMENVMSALRHPEFISAIRSLGSDPPECKDSTSELFQLQQQAKLGDVFHYFGVNLILLPLLLITCRPVSKSSESAKKAWKRVKQLLGVELLARTIKKDFYARSLGSEHTAVSKTEKNLSLAIQEVLSQEAETTPTSHVLLEKCVDTVLKRFYTTPNVVSELAGIIQYCRQECKDIVVSRLCVLLGAQKPKDASNGNLFLEWNPVVKKRLLLRFSDTTFQRFRASVVEKKDEHRKKEEKLSILESTSSLVQQNAIWGPLRAQVYLWDNDLPSAITILQTSLSVLHGLSEGSMEKVDEGQPKKESQQDPSLPISPLIHLRVLFNYIRLLFKTKHQDHFIEGFQQLEFFLDGIKKLRFSPSSTARYHIHVGHVLLSVDNGIADINAEAHRHFLEANRLFQISMHHPTGVQIYLQLSRGILRSVDRLESNRSCLVGTDTEKVLKSLLEQVLVLIKTVQASECLARYLWEFGLELGNLENQLYCESTKLLTKALWIAKKVLCCSVPPRAIAEDLLRIYCKWDSNKYGSYCKQLEALLQANNEEIKDANGLP